MPHSIITSATVTNSAATAITTTKACKKLVVKEDPNVTGWPTTGFNLSFPPNTTPQNEPNVGIPAGGSHVFEPEFGMRMIPKGVIVGYIRAIDVASTTIAIIEE